MIKANKCAQLLCQFVLKSFMIKENNLHRKVTSKIPKKWIQKVLPLKNNAIGEKLLFIEVKYDAKSVILSIKKNKSKLICHCVDFKAIDFLVCSILCSLNTESMTLVIPIIL